MIPIHYIARQRSDGWFTAEIPDYPSCIAVAPTKEELDAKVEEVVLAWLAGREPSDDAGAEDAGIGEVHFDNEPDEEEAQETSVHRVDRKRELTDWDLKHSRIIRNGIPLKPST